MTLENQKRHVRPWRVVAAEAATEARRVIEPIEELDAALEEDRAQPKPVASQSNPLPSKAQAPTG